MADKETQEADETLNQQTQNEEDDLMEEDTDSQVGIEVERKGTNKRRRDAIDKGKATKKKANVQRNSKKSTEGKFKEIEKTIKRTDEKKTMDSLLDGIGKTEIRKIEVVELEEEEEKEAAYNDLNEEAYVVEEVEEEVQVETEEEGEAEIEEVEIVVMEIEKTMKRTDEKTTTDSLLGGIRKIEIRKIEVVELEEEEEKEAAYNDLNEEAYVVEEVEEEVEVETKEEGEAEIEEVEIVVMEIEEGEEADEGEAEEEFEVEL